MFLSESLFLLTRNDIKRFLELLLVRLKPHLVSSSFVPCSTVVRLRMTKIIMQFRSQSHLAA